MPSGFDWHTRYHDEALEGMRSLTPEERGIYNTILDLIYSRWGPVPENWSWLAGWCNCSVRKAQAVVGELVRKEKLYRTDMRGEIGLMNSRADFEMVSADSRRRKLAEAGAKGARKRFPPKENQPLSDSPAKARPERPLSMSLSLSESVVAESPQPSRKEEQDSQKGVSPREGKLRLDVVKGGKP